MESTSTSPSVAIDTASPDAASKAVDQIGSTEEEETAGDRTKWYAILGGVGLLLVFTLITVGLYLLGDGDQSTLERLRDIAIIYVVLMSLIIVVLMAAGTAALIYLVLQIRNKVLPLLEETTQTVNRVRGTTEFMSDEAVKPLISAAGKVAQWKAMLRVVSRR